MHAFKSTRKEVTGQRSTIDIYAIWDMDPPSPINCEAELLPDYKSLKDIHKTRNLYLDTPRKFALQDDRRSPRLLWRVFNTWIGKLGSLLW